MKWVLIKGSHINADNLDAFTWVKGELILQYNGDPTPYRYNDPDRQLYRKLCRLLCVLPYEGGDEDG